MTARDEILARLARAARQTQHPPPWTSRRQFPDLAATFTQALTAAHGEVRHFASWSAAADHLDALWLELNAHLVVANAEAPLIALAPATRWPHLPWHWPGADAAAWREQCAQADVGLTGAATALAETGTIILHSGSGCSRLTALLPPIHVALVSAANLTPDLFTWTAARQEPPPAAITLVSGPSKTADIEQTMAIGVHGPKRLIVLLYQEEKPDSVSKN
ncbi:MAG: LUD domain-containing protein [Candidatus Promineifilaceae bacterium]